MRATTSGAGLAYGYQWVLGKHWSFEASLGLGYVRAHYDRYDCPRCGEWKGKGDKNYLGVTKAAILPYLCNQVNRRRTWK